eukprot:SAG11_NODE_19844_length_457_cov_2.681564_1_plen_44_part_10
MRGGQNAELRAELAAAAELRAEATAAAERQILRLSQLVRPAHPH